MRTSQAELTSALEDDRGKDGAGDGHLVQAAISRAQQGEMDAIRFLYVCYAAEILRCVKGLVKDSHEAEDITQEVFIKLIAVIDQYTPRGEVPFGAWIRRVARNCAYDHLRSRRATPCEELYLHSEHGQVEHERRHDICHALDSLPKEQREVIVLRHIVGLSPVEIAKILGKTESSIHGLHHRGRVNFRVSLAKLGAMPVVAPSHRAEHQRSRGDRPAPTEPEAGIRRPRGTSLRV